MTNLATSSLVARIMFYSSLFSHPIGTQLVEHINDDRDESLKEWWWRLPDSRTLMVSKYSYYRLTPHNISLLCLLVLARKSQKIREIWSNSAATSQQRCLSWWGTAADVLRTEPGLGAGGQLELCRQGQQGGLAGKGTCLVDFHITTSHVHQHTRQHMYL